MTFEVQKYNIYLRFKSEVKWLNAKMGRPTENPQTYQATVRFDEECKEILDEYCSQEQVGRNEAIRRGIKKLKCDIKK